MNLLFTEICVCSCCCLVTKQCLILSDSVDCSSPGSSAHGISQARILEWVAISFSRGSSLPRDQNQVSCIGRWVLYHWDTWAWLKLFETEVYMVAQTVKNLPAMHKAWVWSLGWEDPLEEGMATHTSFLAWRIPWTEEPGRSSIGLHRVGHDWSDLAHTQRLVLGSSF